MPREKMSDKRMRAIEVSKRMDEHYPHAECALHYTTPFTLTIAVLLSAQTTDTAVNKVTPQLFERFPTPEAMAQADPSEVAEIIHSLGFYRNKAKNCVACAQMIMSDFGGEVPKTIKEMQRLPGVGRKTANVVLNEAFGIVEGIAVDTHVFRIAHQLKFSSADTPAKTENDLLKLYPREYWKSINHQWVLFGRECCIARRPHCSECFIADLCPAGKKILKQK